MTERATSSRSPASGPPDAGLDRLSEQGCALYERLKADLEPAHNGRTVALHLDSGDYALGKDSPGALRALRQRHPAGMVMTMLVGPEREDPTLARLLGNGLAGGRQ